MQRQEGEWLIGDAIAEGAAGVVYAARHTRWPGEFVVKEIRLSLTPDFEVRAQYLRSAAGTVRLHHPNIVRTIETFEGGDRLFVAMTRLRGDTIASALRSTTTDGRPNTWALDAAVSIVHQVASELGYAHERSIVHRDIKPSHIFVEDGGRALLLDFGMSAKPGPGTYAPPEVLLGAEATPASDVFSLGLVFFRMLTGRWPFRAADPRRASGTLRAYSKDLPRVSESRPDVPRPIDILVAQMLSIDPWLRPKDGHRVAQALTESKGSPIGPPAPGTALGVLGVQHDAPSPARRSSSSGGREPPPWDSPVPVAPPWDTPSSGPTPRTEPDARPAPEPRVVLGTPIETGAAPPRPAQRAGLRPRPAGPTQRPTRSSVDDSGATNH